METSPVSFKELLRERTNGDWRKDIEAKVLAVEKGKKIKLWTDLVSDKEYLRALEQHYGSLGVLAGKKYLDVGAGLGGRLHELLKQQGVEITNVDIAPASIKYLKKVQRETGFVADIFKLAQTVDEKAYDGVIAVNLINTGAAIDREDLVDIFKQVHLVLNDGGCFIQSHFGFFAQFIAKDKQLASTEAAGFDNILQLMQKTRRSEPAYPMPLSFIAQKGEKK